MFSQERVEAFRRRVWRVAFLLTGNTDAAGQLFKLIMRDRRRIESIDPARLDRLVVMRAREHAERTRQQFDPEPALAPVYALDEQPLEAWVLRRVEQLDEITAARAMDCSKTALRLHLNVADEALAQAKVDAEVLASALRQRADTLDPAPTIEAWRKTRRRRSLVKLAVIAALLITAAITLWRTWA